ncbi:hypothetical protein F5Y17DRAFT_23894 [Xylariaceae sp. FL0594]|nr:hypothetical protein F5Y17DRAFT_23894 [Xylariaceae sp. FL0594]
MKSFNTTSTGRAGKAGTCVADIRFYIVMRRISKKVQDDRFQNWDKVKSWLMTSRRKLQQSRKKSSYRAGSMFDGVIPVLDTAEMHNNRQKFLDSVLSTIGPAKLKDFFNHRLTSDSLPEDIAELVFSPAFLKLAKKTKTPGPKG